MVTTTFSGQLIDGYTLNAGSDSSLTLTDPNGNVTTLQGATFAGVGLAGIRAANTQHKTAAPTTVTYTPPAKAGTYRVNVAVDVKTATSIALKLKLSYTGADGDAAASDIVWTVLGSTTLVTSVTTAVFASFSFPINIDNSATAISLADDSGTYTTCDYTLSVVIEQLA